MEKILSLLLFFHLFLVFQSCTTNDEALEERDYEYNEFGTEETSDFVDENDQEVEVFVLDDELAKEGFLPAKEVFSKKRSVTRKDQALFSGQRALASEGQALSRGELLEYQAKQKDTLMLIAFNIYGNYLRWREIYALNKDVIRKNFDLSHRPVLKYRKPLKPYTPPSGMPYLIRPGDSLSLISKKVYGDFRKWPMIRNNNPRQIRDPNLIFAGFTLYYTTLNKLALLVY